MQHDVKVIEMRTREGMIYFVFVFKYFTPPHLSLYACVMIGYGVRWLHDGSEFRGFLEPQMEDGHLVGWRH